MHPLVFLPGMMCDGRIFASQITAFENDLSVSVGDITTGDTIKQIATNVLTEAPDQFALCGLSMGGIVAMEIMRLAPERVSRVAFLDTNPKAEADRVKQHRQLQIERAKSGDLEALMRDELKPNYLTDGPLKPGILDLCMDMALSLGPDVFVRQSLALRDRPDQQGTLKSIDVPALVLCGRDDRLCPIHRHELMRDLMPNASLQIVDNAGHLPILERPEATTQHLRDWMDGII